MEVLKTRFKDRKIKAIILLEDYSKVGQTTFSNSNNNNNNKNSKIIIIAVEVIPKRKKVKRIRKTKKIKKAKIIVIEMHLLLRLRLHRPLIDKVMKIAFHLLKNGKVKTIQVVMII